jgi:TatD DNase family protein
MFIDTHAHLGYDSYDEDRELVIQRAIEANVGAIITIGTDVETSKEAVGLAQKYATVFAAVGIHPTDCAETTAADLEAIKELTADENVVAIGEIGLDYFHMRAPKEKQHTICAKQIQMAQEVNLPLIIHNRDSHEDMYNLLSELDAGRTGGVMHSFTGNLEFLHNILELDLHVSFTGNITFKKSQANELVVNAPLERLLLETDSPFLTPVPLRGKRNEPAFVVHTARKIAELKNLPVEEIETATTANAVSLFKLDI